MIRKLSFNPKVGWSLEDYQYRRETDKLITVLDRNGVLKQVAKSELGRITNLLVKGGLVMIYNTEVTPDFEAMKMMQNVAISKRRDIIESLTKEIELAANGEVKRK